MLVTGGIIPLTKGIHRETALHAELAQPSAKLGHIAPLNFHFTKHLRNSRFVYSIITPSKYQHEIKKNLRKTSKKHLTDGDGGRMM